MCFNKGSVRSWNKKVSTFKIFKEKVLSIQGALEFSWRLEFRGRIQGGGRAPHLSYNRTLSLSATTFKMPLPYWQMRARCREAAPSKLHLRKILTEILSDKLCYPKKISFCTYDTILWPMVCFYDTILWPMVCWSKSASIIKPRDLGITNCIMWPVAQKPKWPKEIISSGVACSRCKKP